MTISQITKTKDTILLENILNLIQNEQSETYPLSSAELTKVEEAQEQMRNGRSIPHEEVKQRVQEWLER